MARWELLWGRTLQAIVRDCDTQDFCTERRANAKTALRHRKPCLSSPAALAQQWEKEDASFLHLKVMTTSSTPPKKQLKKIFLLLTDLSTKWEEKSTSRVSQSELSLRQSSLQLTHLRGCLGGIPQVPVPGVLRALSHPGVHHALGQLWHRGYGSAPANSEPAEVQVETKSSSLV